MTIKANTTGQAKQQRNNKMITIGLIVEEEIRKAMKEQMNKESYDKTFNKNQKKRGG